MEKSNQDCIFCKIASKKIPCVKVFENSDVLAFLDISPVISGHALVIPKKHCETLIDADKELLEKIMIVVKKVAKAVMKATKADGFNVITNNYRAAGQLVKHLHFHIIPRFKDDGLVLCSWKTGKYKEGMEAKVAEQIRKEL